MSGEKGYVLKEADLLLLSLGAAVLGTGGGGNPYVGRLRAREIMRKGASVRILPLDALPDDAWIGRVGGIGAPVIGIEKISQGEECLRALRAIEEVTGVRMAALIAAEIGGANAMAPIITAGQAGLPVLDGDGMGRAFPEVQMETFSIYGETSLLSALADAKGNVVVFKELADPLTQERFLRSMTVNMGAGAGAAGAPLPMEFVRRTAVPNTVTQAIEIGAAILDARAKRRNVIERVVEKTGGALFFTGKIVDVRRELKGGFTRGHALLEGLDEWTGCEGRIAIQNENLVLWVDGEPKVMVPDLIMNLELETGEPITTEMLRFGQRVAIIGMPAHPLIRSERALQVVGPKAFGYPELSYTPMEYQPAAE
ncbi:MAG: DUF917 domain-containing protein [Rhizobiaceae bacterium]